MTREQFLDKYADKRIIVVNWNDKRGLAIATVLCNEGKLRPFKILGRGKAFMRTGK